MRWLAVLVTTLGLAFVPATAGAKPSACQKLAAHHKDRSPNRKLVLVYRGTTEVGSIDACVLPRGKVRRLANWDDELERNRYSIAATKGVFILIDNFYGDQYGGTSRSLVRYDGRNGNEAALAGYSCQLGYGQTGCSDGTSFRKYVLGANGAGALEMYDLAANTDSLVSFDSRGTLVKLDDAPVDSLKLESGDIVWTRDGAEHRAPLPGR